MIPLRLSAGLLLCQTIFAQAPDALEKGLAFADFYNWADAEQWFETAKATAGQDQRRALYAELGLVRATMERRALPEVSEWIGKQLRDNPLLQTDEELKQFAWMVRADVDLEIDIRPARRSWEQVLAIAQRRSDQKWIRRGQTELGFVAFVEGDVGMAAMTVMSGISAAARANDIGARIRYLTAFGTGLVITRNYQQGLDSIENALRVEAANQPMAGYSFIAREGKLMALLGLKREKEAMALASEILTAARARGRKVKECQALLTLGRHFRDKGDNDQAKRNFTAARDLAEAGGFVRFLASANSALSILAAAEGKSNEAVQLAERSARATLESGDFYYLPDRLYSLAKMYAALGNIEEARKPFEAAEAAAEFVLAWATTVGHRVSVVNAQSRIYRDHFLLYAERGEVNRAFEVLESSRARTMRGVLAGEMISDDRAGMLRAELVRAAELEGIRMIRATLEKDQESGWSPVQRRSVEPVSLRATQSALGPKSVLLEYTLAEPKSYCIVVTRSSVRLVPLRAGEKELTDLINRYGKSLKQKQEDHALARSIHTALLGGVTEAATHPELIVSRDGPLHLMPFEALIGPDNQYLVMTHEVTYVPSASTIGMLRGIPAKRRASSGFLGVGGLPYDSGQRLKIAGTRGFDAQFVNLPGSAAEVRNASAISPGQATLLLGNEGTEGAFKTKAPEHRVIHLAVHGRVNSLYPAQAALVLLADPRTKDDGLLRVQEIVQLRIGADLVVLSACDSGVGMLLGEDGIANLSRAFLAGGTRSVISTLWAADDLSATNLLKRFYGRLSARASVTGSLTAAKREFIKTFQLPPYFWAPYIVEGLPGARVQ